MTGEADVVDVDRFHDAVGGTDVDIERSRSRDVERSGPVLREVVGLLHGRPVAPQLLQAACRTASVPLLASVVCRVINTTSASMRARIVHRPGSGRICPNVRGAVDLVRPFEHRHHVRIDAAEIRGQAHESVTPLQIVEGEHPPHQARPAKEADQRPREHEVGDGPESFVGHGIAHTRPARSPDRG